MRPKFKAKKCRNRKCKKEFSPKTEWQKFCSVRCRTAVVNRRNAELIKKGKLVELERELGQQQGVA